MTNQQDREKELLEMSEDILTVEEVCLILHMGRVAVCRALKAGKLPGIKVGGQWRISRKKLKEYIETGTKSVSID